LVVVRGCFLEYRRGAHENAGIEYASIETTELSPRCADRRLNRCLVRRVTLDERRCSAALSNEFMRCHLAALIESARARSDSYVAADDLSAFGRQARGDGSAVT
jgi:hypothetical protein